MKKKFFRPASIEKMYVMTEKLAASTTAFFDVESLSIRFDIRPQSFLISIVTYTSSY